MIVILIILLGTAWWVTRSDGELTIAQAVARSIVVHLIAMGWAVAMGVGRGGQAATAFLGGYAMEWMLSFDNLLAIAMVFAYFKLPKRYESKILQYGLASVAAYRLIFTVLGAALLQRWERPMEVIFGAVILYTAVKLIMSGDEQHAEMVDHNSRWYIRALRRWVPITGDATTPVFFKKKLVQVNTDGYLHAYRTYATPLLACLVAVEATDIVFSMDSAPVVVVVSKDPLIIYSAMMFAVIGLRSMYSLMQSAQKHLPWLSRTVICVLMFAALKMLMQGAWGVVTPWGILALVIGIQLTVDYFLGRAYDA